MRTRVIAVLELVLIFLAALFMTAVALRNLRQLQFEPAQQLVMWYADRMWTLWVLLFSLPLIVLVSGCAELVRNWKRNISVPLTSQKPLAMARAHLASLVVAATTLIAGVILAIVVLHVLAN